MPKTTTMTAAARILLIGSGDIGTRHLQAAVSVPFVRAVDVVDPREEGLDLGKARVKEVSSDSSAIDFRWLKSIDAIKQAGDLCIIATQAAGRLEIFRQAVALGYKNFLIEKIVAQSVKEYQDMLALAASNDVKVWINCKTRAYPFHRRALTKFDPALPIQFQYTTGNHGLACNGIHAVDLFFFYDRSRRLLPVWTRIDPVLHPSKRGGHLFDLSGTWTATSEKGSIFSIMFDASHMAPPCLVISNRDYRYALDHWQPWAYESEAVNGWSWRPAPFEGNLDISHMSKTFIGDILAQRECELPTLADCFPAHEHVLNTLKPHFEKLMGKSLDACPVT